MAAFVLSACLHAGVLAIAVRRGAAPGETEGLRGIAVELVTQDRTSEVVGYDLGKAAGTSKEVSGSGAAPEARGRRADAEATGVEVPLPRSEDPELVEGGGEPLPLAKGAKAHKGKAARKVADKRRRPRVSGRKPVPRARPEAEALGRDAPGSGSGDPATDGTGGETGDRRRIASRGASGTSPGLLPPSMRDALIALLQRQIELCYTAPEGAAHRIVLPVVEIRLRADGALAVPPRTLRRGGSPVDRAVADAALHAVRRCAPYRFPARFAPYYEEWKDIRAEFELSPR